MLGFTLPLLCFGFVEGIVAPNQLLPLPLARPAILVCKLTTRHVGRTCTVCNAAFLTLLRCLVGLHTNMSFEASDHAPFWPNGYAAVHHLSSVS